MRPWATAIVDAVRPTLVVLVSFAWIVSSACLLKMAPFLLAPFFPAPPHCDAGIACDCYFSWVDDSGNPNETWQYCDGGTSATTPVAPNYGCDSGDTCTHWSGGDP